MRRWEPLGDQALIVNAIAAGAQTVRQIKESTGLPEYAVRNVLQTLHHHDLVRRKPTGHFFTYFLTSESGK